MTLFELKNIDVMDIDPDKLVRAADVKVDIDLPKIERMLDMVEQMNGIPNFFISEDGLVVKVSYADTSVSIDERIESWLRAM